MAGNRAIFDKAMNQGHSAAWDQTWEKAAGCYRQALQEFPDDPKALTSLALALYELGDYKEALLFYQRAARVSPEDPIPLEKVAELFERTGRIDQAIGAYMRSAELYVKNKEINKCIDLWQHVISLNPEFIQAYSRLGLVYERLGRTAEAVKAYLIVASLLQHSGDVAKATQAAAHCLQIMPESVDASQAMSMIKLGRLLPLPMPVRSPNEIPAAFRPKPAPVKEEQGEPRIDPLSAARQKAIAELASLVFETMESGGSDKVTGMDAILRDSAPGAGGSKLDVTRNVAILNQVVERLGRKENGAAIAELERAVDAGLEHPAVFYMLGALLVEAGRQEEALAHLQHALANSELAMGANLLLGQALLKLERLPEAAAALLEALKLADMHAVRPEEAEQLAEQYHPLIEAQMQPGQNGASTHMCQSILDLLVSPDWLERVRQTRSQLPAGADGEVPPVADLLLEGVSSEIVEALGRIQKLSRAGKYHSAMEEAFLTLNTAPVYLPLHIAMGDLLLKQGQSSAAVAKFLAVAHTYRMRNENKRAIAIYRKVIEITPMDVATRLELVELLRSTGEIEQAIDEFARIADMYNAMADLALARSTLMQALQMAQEQALPRTLKAGLLARIADLDLQSLDWRSALRTYEQIRLLQPEDEQTRLTIIELNFRLNLANQANNEINQFVKFLLERKKALQALAFMEKVTENHPDQPLAQRMLADGYRQAGRTQEAIERYDRAGELFLKVGNKPAAVESVMAILSLNPPNAGDYQQLLAQLRN